ncbi:MAG: hypothetical protein ACE5KA_01455 [Nitrososphaerales archaeon]
MKERRGIAMGLMLLGLFAFMIPQSFNYAYGHGLSGDQVTASIGDRDATLTVDMKPAFLLAEAPQDATIEMRLFDTSTDRAIEHVTYFVALKKGDTVLMREWFHAHDGDLFIKIRPKDQENTVVNAPEEPILGGKLGSRDAPALATGPIFLEGGLYHFAVEIFSIDFDQTILDPPIKYDAYISIGETTTYPVTNGGEQEISVRTYYDRIQDFGFDDNDKLVKFSMPMNWDQEFLSQVPLVHEEVVIPRSFTDLVAERYTGVVNGVRLPEGAVMVDNSDPNELVIHYMIPNQQLLKIADHVKAMFGDVNRADFILTPGEVDIGVPLEMKMRDSGRMMAVSSKGNIHAMISWSPTTIEPSKTTSFTFNFMDMRTNAPITDATYEFILLRDGEEIVKRQGQTVAGVGAEQFTFNESQAGSVTLRLENINNIGESVDFNIQVVPEFPMSVLMVMGGIVAAMLALTRFKNITSMLQ